jgi:hypothetical protein
LCCQAEPGVGSPLLAGGQRIAAFRKSIWTVSMTDDATELSDVAEMDSPDEAPEPTPKTAARLHRVSGMRLAGMTQYEIASKLGISQTSVCRDLQEIGAAWVKGGLVGVPAVRAVEVARMERLIAMAMIGYQRSIQDKQRTKTVKGSRKGDRTETMTEGQAGNPGFLRVIKECSERIAALLGADAPKTHEVSGPDGGPMTFIGLLAAAAKLPAPAPETDPEILELERLMGAPEPAA